MMQMHHSSFLPVPLFKKFWKGIFYLCGIGCLVCISFGGFGEIFSGRRGRRPLRRKGMFAEKISFGGFGEVFSGRRGRRPLLHRFI